MPKIIAVFADGTGNSAARLFRTNVWRLYQAFDTSNPEPEGLTRQVAYYHNGVGTSSFKPLALVGGAFGWGLKRNILDLYMFLCRNYQPGDRICAFGFSRGAFTVRILAGLIIQEGLVVDTMEEDLGAYARDAYRRYRYQFNQTGGLVRPLRAFRDLVVDSWRRKTGHRTYEERQATSGLKNRRADIDFIGVWDTVAAYGTPIAELTRGIDYWIWPLSMPNYVLSLRVKRARHALALDDERDSFHPLVWDERQENDPDRLSQVWFAGMHSDVGGGYPDDSLAYVSLNWMLTEAEAVGLRFRPTETAEIERTMNPIGPMHDSRRGLGGYYRYQPRKVSARVDPPDPTTLLMQDPNPRARGLLRSVRIHDSVFQRIALGVDRYAPVVVPGDYHIVSSRGATPRAVESQPAKRAMDQERVWDWIWHKRVNYFLTVGLSLYLALFPLWQWIWPATACVEPQCLLAPIVYGVGILAPAMVQPWIVAFAATPGQFALSVLALVLLLTRGSNLQTRVRDDMRALWENSIELMRETTPPPKSGQWVRRLRQHRYYQQSFQFLKWNALPEIFGIALLSIGSVMVATAAGFVVLRGGIWIAENSNVWCQDSRRETFITSMQCWPTGQTVEAQRRYRIIITIVGPTQWRDDTIDTNPEGFGLGTMGVPGNLFAPLRRSLNGRWFQPMVKIVPKRGLFAVVPLETRRADTSEPVYTAQFTAPKTGTLYLFVNDVLLPRWSWLPFYGFSYENNKGAATITLEPVEQGP